MRLFKKTPPPVGRQRQMRAPDRVPNPYIYRSRRSEAALNTGRQEPREPVKPKLRFRKNFWTQRFGLIILGIVVLISLINVLSLSATAKVVPLSSDSRLYLHSQATYQAAASKLLSQSIWNRNKLTIDTSKLSQQLTNQFPELTAVSVTLPLLGHRPIFYLQPAQPALILVEPGGSYVVDTTGKALLRAANNDSFSSLGLPVVNDQSGLHIALNKPALTSDDVSFILTVVTELTAKHIAISNFSLPPASRELDAHLTGQPYFVKFNLQSRDARQQAGTFLAAISKLQGEHITPGQYVDVRLDGRAYYQ